jgi:hypothetical protein
MEFVFLFLYDGILPHQGCRTPQEEFLYEYGAMLERRLTEGNP